MVAPPPTSRPTWTRRLPGWAFALFFLSLILLTYSAVYTYNKGDLVTTGYLAALASVVPVILVIAVYFLVPVWAIPVPLSAEAVAAALARATPGASVEPVAERQPPFSRCVAVVRFSQPRCKVGWYLMSAAERPASGTAGSTVVLRPETRDRKALAVFREGLAASLLRPASAQHET